MRSAPSSRTATKWSSPRALQVPTAPESDSVKWPGGSCRRSSNEGTIMTVEQTLTDEERLAGLDLDQLKQLVGLVEYDGAGDPFPLLGLDAVVWAAGNATQSAHYFQSAFGMELTAFSGPTTGNRDHHAYVLTSGAVRFVMKGAVDPASGLADHHRRHGDGVIDVSLAVPDVDKCIAHARAQGATILVEPHDISDERGTVRV